MDSNALDLARDAIHDAGRDWIWLQIIGAIYFIIPATTQWIAWIRSRGAWVMRCVTGALRWMGSVPVSVVWWWQKPTVRIVGGPNLTCTKVGEEQRYSLRLSVSVVGRAPEASYLDIGRLVATIQQDYGWWKRMWKYTPPLQLSYLQPPDSPGVRLGPKCTKPKLVCFEMSGSLTRTSEDPFMRFIDPDQEFRIDFWPVPGTAS